MKKLLFLALCAILLSASAMAQDSKKGGGDLSYTGFSLNYAFQDVHTDVSILKAVWDGKNDNLAHGFSVGFHVQQNLYKGLILVTGVHYQFTGRINDDVDLTDFGIPYKGDVQYFNHNIIVPIKFGYSFKFGGSSSFSIYGGPSLNFIVSTMENYYRNKDNYIYNDLVLGNRVTRLNGDRHSEHSSDYKYMGWFDIPMGLGAVVKFGRFGLHFEYEWGLVDRWRDKGTDGKFTADQLTAGLVIAF